MPNYLKLIIIKLERKQIFNKISQILLLFVVFYGGSCHFTDSYTRDTSADLIVVKSPVNGIITKVLVNEGATLEKDAGIVEIEVEVDRKTSPITDNSDITIKSDLKNNNEAKIKGAEENVKRTSIEVERVSALVSSNSAPQSQLDAARADFQKAQTNLKNLKEKQRNLRTKNLVSQSDKDKKLQFGTTVNKEFFIIRIPKAGILKVLNAKIGQKVSKGQTVATFSQN